MFHDGYQAPTDKSYTFAADQLLMEVDQLSKTASSRISPLDFSLDFGSSSVSLCKVFNILVPLLASFS